MPFAPDLRLDWCSHDTARYAVRCWHYSRTLPTGKLVKVGVWEDGRFVGCILFSRGAARHIGRPYGLAQTEICELTRVALGAHHAATSRVVAVALRLLRHQSPGLRLVVSYADPQHGHHGGIYQAGNWLYVGQTARECLIRVRGRVMHGRSVSSRWGCRSLAWLRRHVDAKAERVMTLPKHKYLYPFDAGMRAHLLPLVQPYPKREREADSGRPVPSGRGGASPTRSLHCQDAHV